MRALLRQFLLPLAVALSVHAMAQPGDGLEDSGQRTPRSLRAEIRNVERDMFALFNKLNSNDDFDVTCSYDTPTGSKIPLWQCEPAFMRIAEGSEFMQMKDSRAAGASGLTGLGYIPQTREELAYMQREKAAQMQAELRALALEHPELASAVVTLHDLRQQLATLEGDSAD